MNEYITKEQALENFENAYQSSEDSQDFAYYFKAFIDSIAGADVIEREKILDFIEDNRPTDVQTDWERGCRYICDEIEKLLT